MSALKTSLDFNCLESVIDDRAITGTIGEVPHSRHEAAVTPNRVRKVLTGVRPGIINRAEIVLEKYAACVRAPEHHTLIRGLDGVFPNKLGGRDPQVLREFRNVTIGNTSGGHLAAICTDRAVELRLDFFREFPDTPVGDSMPLEMLSESLVLGALLLAEPLNLHQICYHSSSV